MPWPPILGYTAITLWSGSLSDSTVITGDYIVQMAQQGRYPEQAIVIGHLNHPAQVTHVLRATPRPHPRTQPNKITLNDVFLSLSC